MRRLPLLLSIVVTACAGGGGSWPSLARRPIEGPPLVSTGPHKCAAAGTALCLPGGMAVTTDAGPAAPLPVPPTVIDDVAAKLTVIDRDLTDTAARLAAQTATASAAATTARGAAPQSEAWAKAQIELTALDRVRNQVGDIRGRLDTIAGQLAAASAGGSDVAAPLTATGRLIARATALQADYDRTAAALR